MVQVIKSLQDPLEVGNNLPGINSMQGSSFSHSGSTSHPPVRVSRWCKDSCDRAGVISAGLLQLDTVRHLFIQPQQTTACTERPSAFRHDDQKCDHITPVLARLHWLPVTARIQFRIALLTFKTLTTHQPCYIHDLLNDLLTRSTQPCIPPGSLNRVPASAGVRAGISPLSGGR